MWSVIQEPVGMSPPTIAGMLTSYGGRRLDRKSRSGGRTSRQRPPATGVAAPMSKSGRWLRSSVSQGRWPVARMPASTEPAEVPTMRSAVRGSRPASWRARRAPAIQ